MTEYLEEEDGQYSNDFQDDEALFAQCCPDRESKTIK